MKSGGKPPVRVKQVQSNNIPCGKPFFNPGGEEKAVSIQFLNRLIGTVYDKFGEKTKIRKKGEEYSAAVEVKISPTFWSWLTTFKGNMMIAEPKELDDEFQAWIADIKNK